MPNEATLAAAEPARATDPVPAGEPLLPGYTVVAHLRRGRRYDVYDLWSHERACLCVAKILVPDRPADSDAGRCLVREGELLQSLSHVHLVRAWETLLLPRPAVILEPLTGETLEGLIDHRRRRLSLDDVAVLAIQLCSAVRYLHSQGILHLDLKPSNVMRESRYVKVIDLSHARGSGIVEPEVGTPQYMAPEQVRGGLVTTATDVWGIGTLLFEAATGVMPFGRVRCAYEQVKRRAAPVRSLRRAPARFAEAVDQCLDPRPAGRPTLDELAATLGEFATAAPGLWPR
jgi:serine/threonine protein kinase